MRDKDGFYLDFTGFSILFNGADCGIIKFRREKSGPSEAGERESGEEEQLDKYIAQRIDEEDPSRF
jgi:hypothetical protein